VASVVLPGSQGDFTVLHEHHDTVARLRTGIGEYSVDGTRRYLSLFGGVATVCKDEIEVFSPMCEGAEHLDEERARLAKERAEERLAQHEEGIDIARAQGALHRALLRLHAVQLLRQQ